MVTSRSWSTKIGGLTRVISLSTPSEIGSAPLYCGHVPVLFRAPMDAVDHKGPRSTGTRTAHGANRASYRIRQNSPLFIAEVGKR